MLFVLKILPSRSAQQRRERSSLALHKYPMSAGLKWHDIYSHGKYFLGFSRDSNPAFLCFMRLRELLALRLFESSPPVIPTLRRFCCWVGVCRFADSKMGDAVMHSSIHACMHVCVTILDNEEAVSGGFLGGFCECPEKNPTCIGTACVWSRGVVLVTWQPSG